MKLPRLGSISLDGYDLNLDDLFRQDYSDIEKAASDLPALSEWVNEKLSGMLEDRAVTEHDLQQAEAKEYLRLKKGGFLEEHGIRPTDEGIKHAVCLSEKVSECVSRLAVLAGWIKRLNTLQDTLRARMEMLRSVEATKRKLYPE